MNFHQAAVIFCRIRGPFLQVATVEHTGPFCLCPCIVTSAERCRGSERTLREFNRSPYCFQTPPLIFLPFWSLPAGAGKLLDGRGITGRNTRSWPANLTPVFVALDTSLCGTFPLSQKVPSHTLPLYCSDMAILKVTEGVCLSCPYILLWI